MVYELHWARVTRCASSTVSSEGLNPYSTARYKEQNLCHLPSRASPRCGSPLQCRALKHVSTALNKSSLLSDASTSEPQGDWSDGHTAYLGFVMDGIIVPTRSESVREHQAGLQSFRSMRRIEARRRNASAVRLRFSQSLTSLLQRLSQAMVRSTTQRRGGTTNPLA